MPEKPGIIFVSPWLLDGGIERVLEIKAPWFANRGHRVHVLAWEVAQTVSGRPNPVLLALARTGIPVHRIATYGPRLHITQHALRIAIAAKRLGARVLVGHELMANLPVLLAKRLLGNRVRAIAEVHSSLPLPRTGVDPRTLAWARRLLRKADGVVAVSEGVRHEVMDFYGLDPDRVATIYNFLPLAEIRRLAAQATPDEIARPSPFIVACGRLVPTKGFADLIDAFARVRRVRPLTLVILGEGPERPSLERRAIEQGVGRDVVMPGYVVNPFPYIRRAAAFCLSSRFEAFPRVVIEALACGVPVIASRCRWGPEEAFASGRCGLLYDVGDIDQLADHILTVLDDQGLARHLAEQGHHRAEEFDVARLLPQLEHYYLYGTRGASVAASRQGPPATRARSRRLRSTSGAGTRTITSP